MSQRTKPKVTGAFLWPSRASWQAERGLVIRGKRLYKKRNQFNFIGKSIYFSSKIKLILCLSTPPSASESVVFDPQGL